MSEKINSDPSKLLSNLAISMKVFSTVLTASTTCWVTLLAAMVTFRSSNFLSDKIIGRPIIFAQLCPTEYLTQPAHAARAWESGVEDYTEAVPYDVL